MSSPRQIIPVRLASEACKPGPGKNSAILEVESRGPGWSGRPRGGRCRSTSESNVLVTQRRQTSAIAGSEGDPRRRRPLAKSDQDPALGSQEYHTTRTFRSRSPPRTKSPATFRATAPSTAVLAAAMCRAVGIPSRVVDRAGLRRRSNPASASTCGTRSTSTRGGSRSIPTWDQSTVDAAHIKISESSLDGVAPFEAFSPVIRVMGKTGDRPDRVPLSVIPRFEHPLPSLRSAPLNEFTRALLSARLQDRRLPVEGHEPEPAAPSKIIRGGTNMKMHRSVLHASFAVLAVAAWRDFGRCRPGGASSLPKPAPQPKADVPRGPSYRS